jgi:hypothetical protein
VTNKEGETNTKSGMIEYVADGAHEVHVARRASAICKPNSKAIALSLSGVLQKQN